MIPRSKRAPTGDRTARAAAKPEVAESGESPTLEAIVEFVAFTAKPMPLATLLDEAPRQIAKIVNAEVASLYLLEGHGNELVLRGNVGFPVAARGMVRLAVGEGITGMAVEHMRPISMVAASAHGHFKSFPELHEERFPVFLAVPIIGRDGPLGALVLQRSGSRAFDPADVHLTLALTAPISAAIRHAELLDELRERKQPRKAGGGTRKVTLPGVPVVPGRALGAIAALRRPAQGAHSPAGKEEVRMLRSAFELVERELSSLTERARCIGLGKEAAFLQTYLQIASDARLRQRAGDLCGAGAGIGQALGSVAREAARVAVSAAGDPFLEQRSHDIEDLCDALVMLASGDARAELPAKALLVADQLTVFDVLVSARSNPVGFALTDRANGPRSDVLLRLMGVPAIIDVAGVFRWAAPGDIALLDADHGFLVINPSRAEVAGWRAARRDALEKAEV